MADREHVPSRDCWCVSHVLAYGETPTYDDHGNVTGYVALEDDEDDDA